jgi:hypothetical protein
MATKASSACQRGSGLSIRRLSIFTDPAYNTNRGYREFREATPGGRAIFALLLELTDWTLDLQNAAMNKMSPHLQRNSLMLIVTSVAIGLFLGHSLNASAAGKESPVPAQNALGAGRLVIVRSATLGLKIDGKEAAQITYNRRYDAPLAPGSHILTVYPVVSLKGAKPTEIRVNVEPGKTYKFTAARQDIQLVLQKGL